MRPFRILIVEDNWQQAQHREAQIRELFAHLQAAIPLGACAITHAGCARDARRVLQEAAPPFDLLLTDLVLPEAAGLPEDPKAGFGLLRFVQEQNVVALYVVISVLKQHKIKVQAEFGAADFIDKSGTEAAAQAKIRECVLEVWRARSPESALIGRLQERIIGQSPAMRSVFRQVAQMIEGHAPVLLLGETGTGKELLAEAIHALNPQATGEFVPLNLSEYPTELRMSALFGHKKGSFTGAVTDHRGACTQARQGTLFLDEIGELGESAQVTLLRVLRSKRFQPIGSNDLQWLETRLLFATNRNLPAAVAAGKMREDFRYRLEQGFVIELPPLRDREDDLPLLAQHFLRKYATGGRRLAFDEATLEYFQSLPWPGNIAQLESVVQQAVALCPGDQIAIRHVLEALGQRSLTALPPPPAPLRHPLAPSLLEQIQAALDAPEAATEPWEALRTRLHRKIDYVIYSKALELHGNQTKAAEALKINRDTLARRLTDCGWKGDEA